MTWRWKLRSWLSRGKLDRDLDDELRAHLEMRANELEKTGMSAAEADAEARRRFGNTALIREQARENHFGGQFEALWHDLRFACRVLAREPGFAAAVVLTLAVVIGANGAMFSLIDAALLRPPQYPHPEQLVFLWGNDAQHKRTLISPADLEDWRRRAKSFTALSSLMGQSVNLTGIEQPVRLAGAFVSSDYFRILGVNAAGGRTFQDADERPGAEPTAVISYGLWQERFGGDPAVVGRSIILNGEPFTVAGILPRAFVPPFAAADVFLPPRFYPGYSMDRARQCVVAIGRLKPGITPGQAKSELDTITRHLARAYPDTNRDRGAAPISFRNLMSEDLQAILFALAAALGCLLLIACANVANLLLSKAAGRRQEMALRAALGAGGVRLMRQLLTESLLLGLSGAILGVAVAYAVKAYVLATWTSWPQGVRADLNVTVLAFMAATAIFTAVAFGLAPALMARREAETLRVRSSFSRTPLRSALAIGQVALALVMLISLGLMMSTFRHLLEVDAGFDGSRVLTLEYRVPANKYATGASQTRFHEEVLASVRRLPGIESASIVRGLPFSGNGDAVQIGLPDRLAPPPSAPFFALYNAATPGYFETVHIPVRAGRDFRPADDSIAPRVVIVSESFVRRFWPGRNALGRQVLIPNRDPALASEKVPLIAATVIGVVGNVRHDRLDEPGTPQLYVPYAQDPITFATLVLRTGGNPMNHVKDVQRAVWSVDKDQPVWKIRTLASLVVASLGPRRLVLALLAWFSGVAVLLAALGLYALMSYQATQRRGELGIRVALGASSWIIVRMILRQGLVLATVGAGAGIALAPLLARALQTQLYGVGAVDVSVYAVFAVLLLAVSAAAVLPPAIRAARIDPVIALRAE